MFSIRKFHHTQIYFSIYKDIDNYNSCIYNILLFFNINRFLCHIDSFHWYTQSFCLQLITIDVSYLYKIYHSFYHVLAFILNVPKPRAFFFHSSKWNTSLHRLRYTHRKLWNDIENRGTQKKQFNAFDSGFFKQRFLFFQIGFDNFIIYTRMRPLHKYVHSNTSEHVTHVGWRFLGRRNKIQENPKTFRSLFGFYTIIGFSPNSI